MEAARRALQVIRFAMLFSMIALFYVASAIPSQATPNPIIFRALALLAVADLVILFLMRKSFVSAPAEILPSSPEDAAAINRWRSGTLISYALAEAIALYGLVLHFLGSSFTQLGPFFGAGVF